MVPFWSSLKTTGPASTLDVVEASASISMPPTVMVKLRVARPPPMLTADTVTVNAPVRVGAPQIWRTVPQAPVPSASNAMPGGSPLTS